MHWLMKSEPHEFSIDDLARRKREPWTGVRNYQARNHLRDDMQVDDEVLFYHSSCEEPAVAGLARIVRAAYPDPTQFERKSDYYDAGSRKDAPRWLAVDVGFVRRFAVPVTLARLKTIGAPLEGFRLLMRGNRLSVFPVSPDHFHHILALERTT